MSEEEIKKIINETLSDDNKYLYDKVYDIVKRIINLPDKTKTTMSELVNEKDNITIFRLVDNICLKMNIILVQNEEDIVIMKSLNK